MEQSKRPITVEDLTEIIYIEDPNISPDGKWIAYVEVTPDPQETYKRNIWVIATDSGKPVQLTFGNHDSHPRWSPDGKTLAFLSGRNKKPQIYLLRVIQPGGEPRQLTQMPNGVTGFSLSPNNRHIAFLSSMSEEERNREDQDKKTEPPVDKLEARHRQEREDEEEKQRHDPRWTQRIPYRAGTAFLDNRYSQIYIISTAEHPKDETTPKRLTNIDANHELPTWAPDGRYIYTARVIDPEMDEHWLAQNLFKIAISDGATEQIVDETHTVFAPIVSPDGKWIIYARRERKAIDAYRRLALLPTDGGEARDINIELDQQINAYRWINGNQLIITSSKKGNTEIYRCDPLKKSYEKLISGQIETLAIDATINGDIAYIASTPQHPGELYWQPANGAPEQITSINRALFDEVMIQPTREIWFTSPGGIEIQGWYLLPVDYEQGKKVPLLLDIHGGPHVMWHPAQQNKWHEWQLYAANGYAVFYCNPRGSNGYGEAFQRSLHSAWGKVAMEDIMAGVDAITAKNFIDDKQMMITGGSYGGYMTAWIIGHTNRFKAAVTQRGVYNLISFYGTSDVPTLISSSFDIEPWEDPWKLWRNSPVAYAHNIRTPLLIIHAENDYRVPIEQAEQLFAFVRRSTNTPVQLLRYPREGHELSRSGEPKHRISRLKEILNWFDKYRNSVDKSAIRNPI